MVGALSNVFSAFSQMLLPLVFQLCLEGFHESVTQKKNEYFLTSILSLFLKILFCWHLVLLISQRLSKPVLTSLSYIDSSSNLICLYHIRDEKCLTCILLYYYSTIGSTQSVNCAIINVSTVMKFGYRNESRTMYSIMHSIPDWVKPKTYTIDVCFDTLYCAQHY